MLLVVDNCEHVVEAAASVVAALVAGCPGVTVLATSRERLGVDGEQVWRLDPLDPGAAVELFSDRARSVRPGLDFDDGARADVVDICRRLDGLPLAIELAAALTAAMNPADLVARLDDRFRLLDGGARDRPERHRSLRALVDWSYERLDRPSRLVFDRLSVFASGFTLEAAEHVCADDGVEPAAVPRLVADLVEVSLVTVAGGADLTRYRLLETLRDYARDRLDQDGEGERVRERHVDFYLGLAERAATGLRGPDEGRWVRRLDAELDDLRAAHRWAIAHDDAGRALRLTAALAGYAYRSMRPEVFAWAEDAAGHAASKGHPLRPVALGSAATGAWVRGDLDAAQTLATEAVDDAAGRPEGNLGHSALGSAALFRGQLDQARVHIRRAAELADAFGDPYWSVVNFMVENLIVAYGGDTEAAIERGEATLRVARRLDCPSASAWGLYHLGEMLSDHDPARALTLLDESREIAAGVGHAFLTGISGTSATTLRARVGAPNEALRGFLDLIDLWDRAGNWTQQWTMLRSLIATLVRLGRDEPAAVLYGALRASPTAPPVYGADAERLAAAVDAMEEHAGREQVAAWVARGRGMSDGEVLDLARAAASSAS
jgi:predicted ATPase